MAMSGTNADHLARLAAGRKLREAILKHVPNAKTSRLDEPIQVELDAPGFLQRERKVLGGLIDAKVLATIIRQYPIRRTGALDQVSKHLGFDDEKEYSRAVLQLLRQDQGMLR